jgi:hypothetical protein
MSWLAVIPLFITPADTPSTTAHEGAFKSRIEQSTTIELAANETPKSVWRVDASGMATHWQSAMICPTAVRSFQRKDLVPFDGFGLDVGCNFIAADGNAVISLYMTRRKGQSLNDNFVSAQDALKQRLPEAKSMSGDVPAPKGLTFTGALYELGDGTRTGVWVTDVSGWTFKFRATYVAGSQTEVLDTMSELTDRTRSTAGTHLAACAAAPAAERPGTQITDQDRLGALSLIGALGAVGDDKPKTKITEQWCVEEPAGDREVPMLFWRNIANTGNIGAVDRMSLMTVGEPPILLSEGNPAASLLDEKAKGGPVIHQLTTKKADTTFIFAFYSGRPSATTLAPLVKDLALGKKGAIVSFTEGTNTITLPMGDPKPGS